jgi:hypothetical protein
MNKRMLIVMLVASAIVLTIGATGLAKGPESATLTGPDLAEPIELAQSDAAVGQLMMQSGIWSGNAHRASGEPSGHLGQAYTLSWINSGPLDASVEERTIRQLIYPNAENGALIHTPAQPALEGWGPDVIGWFIAPQGLVDALVSLGAQEPKPSAADPIPPGHSVTVTLAVAPADPDRNVGVSDGAGVVASLDGEPVNLVYPAIIGFGLFMALVWAAWRRQPT